MAETRFVTATYREIAERFGIGIEGARLKAKRRAVKGLWRVLPSNHPQDIVRVEVPEDEWNDPRGFSPNRTSDGVPAKPSQQQDKQEPQHRVANELGPLLELISQLTAQSSGMIERLVEAERERAKAERDAAMARVAASAFEERLEILQTSHTAELMDLRKKMEAEISKAQSDLEAWKSRPWWKRLAG